ncbi:NACHT domain-containing protein [Mycena indigotica]|uniref:NACHT domain-containing protein n=1 Tax=Mycena indigotica TaxID=2126181 RepID=A0A8H6SNZ5_9AGAR|nr:NACHT domain-containing protein [Mycena indigotica]KAF7302272.1 NACHT domain-containing protein [Mycena indigotica]
MSWFGKTFDSTFSRSEVEAALSFAVKDVLQDLGPFVNYTEALTISDAPRLEQAERLFDYLNRNSLNGPLIHAFQIAVVRRASIEYMLCQDLKQHHGVDPGPHDVHSPSVDPASLLTKAATSGDRTVPIPADFQRETCHPRTRNNILNDLLAWATTHSDQSALCLLYGPPRTGKSTVMQTLAFRLRNVDHLAGAFFFDRDDPDWRNPNGLFVALAFQLAHADAECRRLIFRALRKEPALVDSTTSWSEQLRKLIVEPCLERNSRAPLAFLIDGLNECEDPEDQELIVSLLKDAVEEIGGPAPFRFLVSSRPTLHVEQLKDDGKLFSASMQHSSDDIHGYLSHEISRVFQAHPSMATNRYYTWPQPLPVVPSTHLDFFVSTSSGIFEHAERIIEFIGNSDENPIERLNLIQRLSTTAPRDPRHTALQALDQLFRHIFDDVSSDERGIMLEILCVILNMVPLSELCRKAPHISLDQVLSRRDGIQSLGLQLSALDGPESDDRWETLSSDEEEADGGGDIRFPEANIDGMDRPTRLIPTAMGGELYSDRSPFYDEPAALSASPTSYNTTTSPPPTGRTPAGYRRRQGFSEDSPFANLFPVAEHESNYTLESSGSMSAERNRSSTAGPSFPQPDYGAPSFPEPVPYMPQGYFETW